jgi:hypothetical protein
MQNWDPRALLKVRNNAINKDYIYETQYTNSGYTGNKKNLKTWRGGL